MTEPTIDEQIERLTNMKDYMARHGLLIYAEILNDELEILQKFKRLDAQPVPVEPEYLIRLRNALKWFKSDGAFAGDKDIVDYIDSLQSALKLAQEELASIRDALAGQDYASLPSDFPTVRMAHTIRADHDKFMQQVRDTCKRAEKAEALAEQNRKDAERYRWLRTHFRFANDSVREIWFDPNIDLAGAYGAHEPDELDAAIDQARAK